MPPHAKKPQNKKIIFDVPEDDEVDQSVSEVSTPKATTKRTKIVFGEDGEVIKKDDGIEDDQNGEDDETDYFDKRDKERLKRQQLAAAEQESELKWYLVHKNYPCNDDLVEMKDSEQTELYNLCKNAYASEKSTFAKRNPQEARWLQTALHKGTAKDSANAGALLVTTNPLGNLDALSTLIGFCKSSNKAIAEVVGILTDLWREVLLPPHRKLLTIQLRGADWKHLRKDSTLTNEMQKRIYAYWFFENELKELYFEFLKNIQQALQTGQENSKNIAIVSASQLLSYAPEKEQMLLTMLVNKLGDPVAKIAAKALHHLTEVALKHPNMSGVIVIETEKLLFRNNISERAQHFALCFLANITPAGRPEVCSKLVNICFALFKVLVQKGCVNNRTMQAILRCLQKAIVEAQPESGSSEVLNKEMQDTIYRLVHQADIRVSVQTLGLLLQLITMKTQKADRFYNALYVRLLDLNLVEIGISTAAQLLHIVHRAIHMDGNVPRAHAFIKRLLQLALYTPANVTAGCLIVLNKLLRHRRELIIAGGGTEVDEPTIIKSSAAEKSPEILTEEQSEQKPEITVAYNPYHRVPAFAKAEGSLRYELLLLQSHYHPTVQVFAENILNNTRINYYGDPLKDFGLAHFLERFAFKNPKQLQNQKVDGSSGGLHKRYVSFGSRSKPVKLLTKDNCAEDEKYIFSYLDAKRARRAVREQIKDSQEEAEGQHGDVSDDEFEAYLDGFFGQKSSADDGLDDELGDIDFLGDLSELKEDKPKKKAKKAKSVTNEDDDGDADDDWPADDGQDSEAESDDEEGTPMSGDEADSIDFGDDDDNEDDDVDVDENIMEDDDDDDDDDDVDDDDDDKFDFGGDSEDSEEEEELQARQSKKPTKRKTELDERNFAKKLKFTDDLNSLFAAADDFGELLENTGKTKGQGTINAVLNKDKSSDKQLKWEEKRRSNSKIYKGKKAYKGAPAAGKNASKSHKRKH